VRFHQPPTEEGMWRRAMYAIFAGDVTDDVTDDAVMLRHIKQRQQLEHGGHQRRMDAASRILLRLDLQRWKP